MTRRFSGLAALVILLIAGFLIWSRGIRWDSPGDHPVKNVSSSAKAGPPDGSPRLPPPRGTPARVTESQLDRDTAGYDALSKRFHGKELETERLNYIIGIANQPREAMDLCRLMEHAAGDFGEDGLTQLAGVLPAVMGHAYDAALEKSGDPDSLPAAGFLDEVANWIVTSGNPFFRHELVSKAGYWYAQHPGMKVSEFAQQLASPALKDRFLAGYLRMAVMETPAPIFEILSVAPAEGSSPEIAAVIRAMKAPKDIANLPKMLTGPGGIPSPAIFDALLGKWATLDPANAAAFINDSSAALDVAIDASLNRMAASSDGTLPTIIENLPSSKKKDRLISSSLREVSHYPPDKAWQLGLQVSDPQLRADLLDRVYQEWQSQDPGAADAALAKFGNDQQ